MKRKKKDLTKIVFYKMIIVFILMLIFFFFPDAELFTLAAIAGLIFFILGIVLLILTLKKKKKNKQRKFLLMTSIGSIGVLAGSILHNLLYAMAILTQETLLLSWLFEFLHAAFFIFSLIVCPILFIVGTIGTVIHYRKK